MVAVDPSSSERQRPIDGSSHRKIRQSLHRLQWIVWVVVTGLVLLWIVQGYQLISENEMGSVDSTTITVDRSCPVMRISDLSEDILNPKEGPRWVVTPPQGGDVHLMCCHTTKGPLSILLHSAWAPIGVSHLLEMLSQGYWDYEVPLFRCTDACQFGLSSNATWTKRFGNSIQDDPLWIPTGPSHRTIRGIARYPKGVLTYAGGGPHTRSNQFVITLKRNSFMGGGSPWEVPLGEVVGESDAVLDQLYNGYGEKGPSQALLKKGGVTADVKAEWPLMDCIQRCQLVDTRVVA